MKGYCEICGTEIEVQICCNAFDCGCLGLPTEPPVCSSECYDKYMDKPDQSNDETMDKNATLFPDKDDSEKVL